MRRIKTGAFVAAIVGMIWVGAASAQDAALEREFEFASALVDLGFADFADRLLTVLLREHPNMAEHAKFTQVEILLGRGRLAEAEEVAQSLPADSPKAQAMRLKLGNYYFATGDTDKAKDIYTAFFGRYKGNIPTDPVLLKMYRESAYRFAQMQKSAGDIAGAITAYNYYLASKPDSDTESAVQALQIELYLQLAASETGQAREQALASAAKMAEAIQWKGADSVWFGHSFVHLANIEFLRGRNDKARKIIKSSLDIIKNIDDALDQNEKYVSPMAPMRFLEGQMYQKEGEDALKDASRREEALQLLGKALREYYNVFTQYTKSDQGPEAGARVRTLEAKLKELGAKVAVDLGAQQAHAEAASFKLADDLFRARRYAEAAPEYGRIISLFPSGEAAMSALGNLALCYANLHDDLMLKMVVSHAAERFSGAATAANALLRTAKFYFDQTNKPMYTYVYESYLDHFPQHDQAGAVLFLLAIESKKAGNEAKANQYFQRILDEYPKDAYYSRALSQMAWTHYAARDYERAVEGFRAFIKETQPSVSRAQAQSALANSLLELKRFADAAAEFETLIQWLGPKNNPYGVKAEDIKKNTELLEKAVFSRAVCFAVMTGSPEEVSEARTKAIRAFDQFASAYPKSPLMPQALNWKGRILVETGQHDVATQVFDDLEKRYPDSPEGKNALFSMVRSVLEVKQIERAIAGFQNMLAKDYAADEYMRLGQLFLDNAQYPQAIEGFEKVRAAVKDPTQERLLLERSLYGLGQAYFELKQYEKSAQVLEELLQNYPNTGLFYDAKFKLGTAYRELGRLDDAEAALSDVFRYARTPLLINRASFELGMIQQRNPEKLQAALASFQRVELLAPRTAELRPLIERSMLEGIPLAIEIGRATDAIESCDNYMKLFPQGEHLEQVRAWKAEATLKSAGTSPAAGNDSP